MVRRHIALLPLVATLALGACLSTDEEFPADTARVEIDGRRYELDVISCGRDEDLDVFVLGASSADSLLQLLLVIEDDEVDLEASAITFESRDSGVLAAGDGSLLGSPTGAADRLELASIRGDRIDVETAMVPVDAATIDVAEATEIDLVARCPAVEEVAGRP